MMVPSVFTKYGVTAESILSWLYYSTPC